MKHNMRLKKDPFEKICAGKKTVELRLFDEKRKNVNVGDTIEFECPDLEGKNITVRVLALHLFGSFRELYATIPLEKCGYCKDEVKKASYTDMEAYYSAEEQAKYGVVGIEFEPEKK
ncbi:MAG: ASCH domain-containing protein [Ruminococcaceae bacterium]|nr:ASCH domain-containing protein [Oscillospiraceae bacterium]